MVINFSIQDILGSLVALVLFSLVFVFPGYFFGWIFDLFSFRRRLPFVQVGMGIVLSNALSPVLLFLLYRFFSAGFAIIVLCLLAVAAIFIFVLVLARRNKNISIEPEIKRYQKLILLGAAAWGIFCTLILVDWQFGSRLYFTTVSYDLTTRVALIDAITRTGAVPFINPSYYPGHPVQLTFLYYFWYILGSVVDQVGGSVVSAYHAMIASIAWCGLSLAATMALYLRLRNPDRGRKAWRASMLAAQLFCIGGFDFLPVIVLLVGFRLSVGIMPLNGFAEGWNMPIMSWMNAIIWVPNHVASATACLTGFMLFMDARQRNKKHLLLAIIFVGASFASALGLSVWVTFTFVIFWLAWMLVLAFSKLERQWVLWMALPGLTALLLAFPFISDLLKGGAGSSTGGGLPVALYVRPFFMTQFMIFLPRPILPLVNLLFLPLNYFMELGFFAVMAVLWFQRRLKTGFKNNPYFLAETLLVILVVLLMSFFRSTLIVINDWGIRGWLPLQFILIVWALDIFEPTNNARDESEIRLPYLFSFKRLMPSVKLILLIGFLTSVTEVVLDRFWPLMIDNNITGLPQELSSDTQLGSRTYAARQAYDFANQFFPDNVIYQNNPVTTLDRPAGLYGTRQMVIADRTAYGVAPDQYTAMVKAINPIFTQAYSDWESIDSVCRQNIIDVLVVNDTDALWSSLGILEETRQPFYQNNYYALLPCGDFAGR